MLTALEQVLQSQYATTLTNEFPKFTWHNYFMNSGTYDIQVTNVYTDTTTLPPAFTGPQWQLFRSHLFGNRGNWQAGNAGVRVVEAKAYPYTIPVTTTEQLGVHYIEFLARDNNPTPPNASAILTVTLTTSRPVSTASRDARVSVLPIIDFINGPKPPNLFIAPQPESAFSSRYSFRVHNFGPCGRVTLIVNDVSPDFIFMHRVSTEVVVPPVPTRTAPCSVEILP
jgi:hypothetical protein